MIKKSSLEYIIEKIEESYHNRAFEIRQFSLFWQKYINKDLYDISSFAMEFKGKLNHSFLTSFKQDAEKIGYKYINSGIVKNLAGNMVDLITGKGLSIVDADNFDEKYVLELEKQIKDLELESFLQKAIFEFLIHGSALMDIREDNFNNKVVKIHNPLSFFTIKDFNVLYGITLFDKKDITINNQKKTYTFCETHFRDEKNIQNVLRFFYNHNKEQIAILDLPNEVKKMFIAEGKEYKIVKGKYYLEKMKPNTLNGLILFENKSAVGFNNEFNGAFDDIFDLIWFYDQINSNLATDNFSDLAITYLSAEVLDKDKHGKFIIEKSKRDLIQIIKSSAVGLKENTKAVEMISPNIDYAARLKLKEIVLQDILRAIGLAPITIGIVSTGIDGKELSERREEISFRTRNSYISDLKKPLQELKETFLPDVENVELEFKETITSSLKSRLESAQIAYSLNLPKKEILKMIFPDYSQKQIMELLNEQDEMPNDIDEVEQEQTIENSNNEDITN